MANYTAISSTSQLDSLLSENEYTLIDFWATWCPPCKAIAPIFDKLAAENATEKKLAFAKVDVDAQRAIAERYNISAMPTFLLLRHDEVCKGVRGADGGSIKKLVAYARKKNEGKEVTAEEEAEFSQMESGGQPVGGFFFALLFLAFVVYLFFWGQK